MRAGGQEGDQQRLPQDECRHAHTEGEYNLLFGSLLNRVQIDDWSIDDSSPTEEKRNDNDEEDKDEALEQHLLEMEMEERENESD